LVDKYFFSPFFLKKGKLFGVCTFWFFQIANIWMFPHERLRTAVLKRTVSVLLLDDDVLLRTGKACGLLSRIADSFSAISNSSSHFVSVFLKCGESYQLCYFLGVGRPKLYRVTTQHHLVPSVHQPVDFKPLHNTNARGIRSCYVCPTKLIVDVPFEALALTRSHDSFTSHFANSIEDFWHELSKYVQSQDPLQSMLVTQPAPRPALLTIQPRLTLPPLVTTQPPSLLVKPPPLLATKESEHELTHNELLGELARCKRNLCDLKNDVKRVRLHVASLSTLVERKCGILS